MLYHDVLTKDENALNLSGFRAPVDSARRAAHEARACAAIAFVCSVTCMFMALLRLL